MASNSSELNEHDTGTPQLMDGNNLRGKKNRKFDVKFKLAVVKYAEQNSGLAAARQFNVDPKRVREWKQKKGELLSQSAIDGKRARLSGGGRKKVSEELDANLCQWIHHVRGQNHRVSRKMIRIKAKEMYATASDKRDDGVVFGATSGWLNRFLRRNNFSLRRRTTVAQKDAPVEKIVNFLVFSTKQIEAKKIQPKNIIAMDETAVWFDMVGSSTVSERGARSICLKTTGHEKARVTVALAAKADGTKLKPYIVFKGAVRDVKAMQSIPGVIIASSKNGWFNDDLTKDWLQRAVGKFHFGPRLLAWDSYRCHISEATKAELKRGYNLTMAIIPGGCTKYLQAPDVVWNGPFKAQLRDYYDNWIAGDKDKTYTKSGNLRAPSRRLLVDWVLGAWDALDRDTLINSFKVGCVCVCVCVCACVSVCCKQ